MVLGLFLVLLILPIGLQTFGNLSHKSYLLALSGACILFAALALFRRRGQKLFDRVNRCNPILICILLSAVCLIVNGSFAYLFRPEQAADYRTFFQVAKDLSLGNHPGMKDYVAMLPHILGYSSFLSVFLRVFGQNLMVAVWLNVVLTAVTGIILFCLTCDMTDLASGSAAYLFWILCPSKMFYNTMSLSEPYYTCLLMLFFLLVFCSAKLISSGNRKQQIKAAFAAMICGVVLALVQSARPIALIPIIALVLWVVFLSDLKMLRDSWKEWTVFILILILAYAGGEKLWNGYASEQLEQNPPAIPGYNIYVGFNLETNGSYADEDMELLQSRYFGEYERNAEATQQRMLEDAKTRIAEARPVMMRLMIAKLTTLLGHDEGGVFYALESLSSSQYRLGCLISNIWYYLIIFFSVCGTVRLWRQREQCAVFVAVLFVIGLILAQLLVEVAARYHYALVPILLLVSAFAFQVRTKELHFKGV